MNSTRYLIVGGGMTADAAVKGIREHDADSPIVLVALALNGIPIDVLAERLGSNRNALYKSLHDARRNLRAYLEAHGFTEGF